MGLGRFSKTLNKMLQYIYSHPGRSASEDPGSPAVDKVRRCRIGVRHDMNVFIRVINSYNTLSKHPHNLFTTFAMESQVPSASKSGS